jgi:hypothetical protein
MLHPACGDASPGFKNDTDRSIAATYHPFGGGRQDRLGRGREARMFGRGKTSLSRILLLVAVIVFVVAAIGIDVKGISLVPIGLALGFASFLVP